MNKKKPAKTSSTKFGLQASKNKVNTQNKELVSISKIIHIILAIYFLISCAIKYITNNGENVYKYSPQYRLLRRHCTVF